MPRCGCGSQTCACAVQGMDGLTVDVDVSGTGTEGAPYVVTAEVIIAPDGATGGPNLLRARADGLEVTCGDVRDCAGCERDLVLDLTAPTDGFAWDDYYSPRDVALTRVLASLTTPGSGVTVVDLYVNGVAVGEAVILAGDAVGTAALAVPAALRSGLDRLSVVCTSAGAGSAGLVVVCVTDWCVDGTIFEGG